MDGESVGPFAENAMEWLECWTCENSEDEVQVQPRERLGFTLAVKLASYFEEDLCAVSERSSATTVDWRARHEKR